MTVGVMKQRSSIGLVKLFNKIEVYSESDLGYALFYEREFVLCYMVLLWNNIGGFSVLYRAG